jgi:hypothetical protein
VSSAFDQHDARDQVWDILHPDPAADREARKAFARRHKTAEGP